MTDNEIIKALECCCKNNNCEGCPLDYLTFVSQCASELAISSLDLIHRQQAENDALKNVIKNSFLEKAGCNIDPLAEIKSEAYKEFAKLLRRQSFDGLYVSVDEINNLLKEMAGEDNAKEKE